MTDTPRLPHPGSDDNSWGDILNGFLLVSHNADGTLNAHGSPLLNLADPINDQDAATKAYVDSNSGGSGAITDLIVQDSSQNTIFEVDGDDGVVIKAPSGTNQLVVKDSGNNELFSVTGGGPATDIKFWATGEVLHIMSDADDPAISFFGASPSWQQSASDGDSLITALVNYGLLENGSSWDSHAATTDHDFFITGDGTLPITAQNPGVGFGVESGNHNAHIEIASPTTTGTAYIDLTVVGTDASARVAWDANVGAFTVGTGGHTVAIYSDRIDTGGLPVTGLPTSDPGIAGALWNDDGTPAISTGA